MMERAFVIAAFGDRRKQVERLIKNIRSYSDLPIHILTTEDSELGIPTNDFSEYKYDVTIEYVERKWPKGSPREGVRNSNYHKILFAVAHHYHSMCLLDDDMYIVDPAFKDGFAMAERFGAAIPINPRTFTQYNLMGNDVRHEDVAELGKAGAPMFFPAVNFSPFFVYPHHGLTSNFLSCLKNKLKEPCRGTIVIYKAMWETHITPVILPEQWCVCASNSEYIKNHTEQLRGKDISIPTIMLHLGHDKVKEVYNVE